MMDTREIGPVDPPHSLSASARDIEIIIRRLLGKDGLDKAERHCRTVFARALKTDGRGP